MKTVGKIKNKDVVVHAPPSKAHTLRALIIGSLADGTSTIANPLLGEDQQNVIRCLRGLGVEITVEAGKIIVYGRGPGYNPIAEEINVGESGVGMNFLTSAANFSNKPIIITGSKRIRERPVLEVVRGLRQLGCEIEYLENEGFLPVRIQGGSIKGGNAKIQGGPQYFSSIAISSACAENSVTLECVDDLTEKPYFDITLQMMSEFGVEAQNNNYKKIIILNNKKYLGKEITIEGDYSSASFFFLAAAICGSKVTVKNLNPETKQSDKAFVDLMEQMGCKVSATDNAVCIQGRQLSAIEKDMSDIPDLVPPLAVACAFARGTSRLTNIGHLRLKECDRLAVMASELNKMGIRAECDADSLLIEGNNQAHGTQIDPHNDHRIAMSFAVAGLATGSQTIEDEMCVAKSFPDFWERFAVFTELIYS